MWAAPLCRFAFLASMLCATLFHLLEALQPALSKDVTACQLTWQSVSLGGPPLTFNLLPRGLQSAAASLCSTPLRFLLPWATYLLCSIGALLWLQQAACTARASWGAGAAALMAALLPTVILVSERKVALVLLLGTIEVWATASLLARARLPSPAMASGLLLGVIQVQLFFATGHLCEFAGLDYTAAFVGSDEFDLTRGAALMMLETFGSMALVALAAPGVAAEVANVAMQLEAKQEAGRAALTFQLTRAITAFAAMLSAAIQRRHLYAWALFAPRFVFEAAFLLVTDLMLLVSGSV